MIFAICVAFGSSLGAAELSHGLPITDFVHERAVAPDQDVPHWYVLTGAPGAGKTSIINYLATQGYAVTYEPAASVIKEGIDAGDHAPWSDPCFDRKIVMRFHQGVALAHHSEGSALTRIFDRTLVDALVYVIRANEKKEKEGLPLDSDSDRVVIDALARMLSERKFQLTVFFVEQLGFCETNEGRPEGLTEACDIAERLRKAYADLGFKLISVNDLKATVDEAATDTEVLEANIAERGDFIADCIEQEKRRSLK